MNTNDSQRKSYESSSAIRVRHLLSFDAALRLKQEEYHLADNTLARTIEYDYDTSGNRTSRTIDSAAETYTIDTANGYEVSFIDGPGSDDSSFSYDNGGRLMSLDRDGDPRTLTYNAAGQLTGVNGVGPSNINYVYQYDGLGNRVSATNASTVRNFLVAPAAQRLGLGDLDVTVQHLATSTTGGVTNLTGWVYAGENPILRYDAGGNVQYYLEDASDSIAALVNSSQTKTADYRYDAFGNLLTGSSTPTSAAGGDFGFHAAWLENATGLYYMRARTYDSEIGRFTTPDPVAPDPQIAETYEPYSFAKNNPHLYSDPTGLFSLTEINVSGAIQTSLGRLQTVALQQRASERVILFSCFQSRTPKRVIKVGDGRLNQ